MTQRKFKHKPTGIIFELGCKNCVVPKSLIEEQDYGTVPLWMVENSTDWQEITEPELVEGKWIVTAGNKTARIYDIEGYDVMLDNVLKFSCNHIGNVTVSKSSIDRQATAIEIHKALDAIRKHKGLVKGVKVCDIGGEKYIVSTGLYYDANEDVLFADADKGYSVCLYQKGQWAEKVEEPILVTKDNVAKYEGDLVYVVHSEEWIVSETYCSHDLTKPPLNKIPFHEKQKAFYYIEDNQPLYSNEDLSHIKREVKEAIDNYPIKHELKDVIMAAIENLKNSKND